MKIEHIAIWVENLDVMRDFYIEYFNAKSNDLYHNPRKEFKSYFLTFDSGARIELMHKPQLRKLTNPHDAIFGYAHFAMSLGCLLYTSPSPRDATLSRMPSSA